MGARETSGAAKFSLGRVSGSPEDSVWRVFILDSRQPFTIEKNQKQLYIDKKLLNHLPKQLYRCWLSCLAWPSNYTCLLRNWRSPGFCEEDSKASPGWIPNSLRWDPIPCWLWFYLLWEHRNLHFIIPLEMHYEGCFVSVSKNVIPILSSGWLLFWTKEYPLFSKGKTTLARLLLGGGTWGKLFFRFLWGTKNGTAQLVTMIQKHFGIQLKSSRRC